MELITSPEAWIAFATLTALELVLGIDNIIFISILVDKLPIEKRELARKIGLFMAMFMRIGLLLVLSWIVGLVAPLITLAGHEVSGRDLILILGGLFLLWKSTTEIHHSLEGFEGQQSVGKHATFSSVIVQIMLIDLVFSLDSIITAVGMVDRIEIMIAAVMASVVLMMVFAKAIGDFVSNHPSIKMLALSFLVLVGMVLIAEGFEICVEVATENLLQLRVTLKLRSNDPLLHRNERGVVVRKLLAIRLSLNFHFTKRIVRLLNLRVFFGRTNVVGRRLEQAFHLGFGLLLAALRQRQQRLCFVHTSRGVFNRNQVVVAFFTG
jgi:predicted tellurium resistance membrane protein TerC